MLDRGRDRLRRRTWIRVLVALLFAINVPLSTSLASTMTPGEARSAAPAMSCHEPAATNAPDDGAPDPSAALQHLCCFTACIPLAATADSTIALALPVGEPLLSLLPIRLTPRVIGVDPPPPRR